MEKIKVLNKQTVIELLEKGMILSYNNLTAKVYIIDANSNIFGAVRFETYLNLNKSINLKKKRNTSMMYDLYVKEEK